MLWVVEKTFVASSTPIAKIDSFLSGFELFILSAFKIDSFIMQTYKRKLNLEIYAENFEEWEIAFAFYDWERKGGPAGPTEHPFLNLWTWWISQES